MEFIEISIQLSGLAVDINIIGIKDGTVSVWRFY